MLSDPPRKPMRIEERALDSAEAYAHAAMVDPVTGVFNRRYIQVRLDEELQRSQRHQIPLALLMIEGLLQRHAPGEVLCTGNGGGELFGSSRTRPLLSGLRA